MSFELEIEIEDVAFQVEDLEPTQVPQRSIATLGLHDTMVRILRFLEGMVQMRVLPVTLDNSHIRVGIQL